MEIWREVLACANLEEASTYWYISRLLKATKLDWITLL